jgi:hypothetical protein
MILSRYHYDTKLTEEECGRYVKSSYKGIRSEMISIVSFMTTFEANDIFKAVLLIAKSCLEPKIKLPNQGRSIQIHYTLRRTNLTARMTYKNDAFVNKVHPINPLETFFTTTLRGVTVNLKYFLLI